MPKFVMRLSVQIRSTIADAGVGDGGMKGMKRDEVKQKKV
jgi:hypothetical protein